MSNLDFFNEFFLFIDKLASILIKKISMERLP